MSRSFVASALPSNIAEMSATSEKTSATRQILVIALQIILAIHHVELQSLPSSTIPTTATNRCGLTLPSPDYATQCNATNSFTLPNRKFVDQYAKFCACRPEFVLLSCTDVTDVPQRGCNADGTYNCVTAYFGVNYCTTNPGKPLTSPFPPSGSNPCGPNCNTVCASEGHFCQPACIRYSKELRRFQNVGGCTCTLAQSQEMDVTLSTNDNYVPQCNGDGSWNKLQTGYGGTWCVDSNGNPTGDISFDSGHPASCY